MKDWRIAYYKNFLETLINTKRQQNKSLECIQPKMLAKIIKQKQRSENLSQLDAIRLLIKQVREDKIDL